MATAKVAEEVKGEESKDEESKGEKVKSKLDDSQKNLINFIFDMKLIKQSIVSVGYDTEKLPLGELDKETVQQGYRYLREIEAVLNGTSRGDLTDLSIKFYTHIPHSFKSKKLSSLVINTKDLLQQKLDLIQNLIDIKTAHQILNSDAKDSKQSIIDSNYDKLKCDITTLKQGSDEYKLVEEFLDNTRGY